MTAGRDDQGSASGSGAQSAGNVFAYGTLRFPAIAEAVTGRGLAGESAVLEGFALFALRDEPYPGIVPAAGSRVEGVLYRDLDAVALRRIDSFEDALYRRVGVRVLPLAGGPSIRAVSYVVRPQWRSALAPTAWDPQDFARHWHDAYVAIARAERLAGELD